MSAMAVIAYKWLNVARIYGADARIVSNADDLAGMLEKKDTVEFEDGNTPYNIPTGFFIESLAFVSPTDVNVTGYIWQKYPVYFPETIKKGFCFPEEINSSATKIELVYTDNGSSSESLFTTLGWYFDVTVRQPRDYSKYPLDIHTIWLRIWAVDFSIDRSILFVPDFSSYADMSGNCFGLDKNIFFGDWVLDKTFFSYTNIPYDTNFGFSEADTSYVSKEFQINFGIRRKFFDAFINNLVPLFIIALLLFGQLMTISGEKERANIFGFNTSTILSTCSALFFTVLLSHLHVRGQFAGSGLVYLEVFYLIMYVVILLVALNSYVFTIDGLKKCKLIQWRDNLIPKIAFWPLLLWMLALATWIKL